MGGDPFQIKGKTNTGKKVLHLRACPPWEYPIPHSALATELPQTRCSNIHTRSQVTELTGHPSRSNSKGAGHLAGESPRKFFCTQGNVNTIVVESRDTCKRDSLAAYVLP